MVDESLRRLRKVVEERRRMRNLETTNKTGRKVQQEASSSALQEQRHRIVANLTVVQGQFECELEPAIETDAKLTTTTPQRPPMAMATEAHPQSRSHQKQPSPQRRLYGEYAAAAASAAITTTNATATGTMKMPPPKHIITSNPLTATKEEEGVVLPGGRLPPPQSTLKHENGLPPTSLSSLPSQMFVGGSGGDGPTRQQDETTRRNNTRSKLSWCDVSTNSIHRQQVGAGAGASSMDLERTLQQGKDNLLQLLQLPKRGSVTATEAKAKGTRAKAAAMTTSYTTSSAPSAAPPTSPLPSSTPHSPPHPPPLPKVVVKTPRGLMAVGAVVDHLCRGGNVSDAAEVFDYEVQGLDHHHDHRRHRDHCHDHRRQGTLPSSSSPNRTQHNHRHQQCCGPLMDDTCQDWSSFRRHGRPSGCDDLDDDLDTFYDDDNDEALSLDPTFDNDDQWTDMGDDDETYTRTLETLETRDRTLETLETFETRDGGSYLEEEGDDHVPTFTAQESQNNDEEEEKTSKASLKDDCLPHLPRSQQEQPPRRLEFLNMEAVLESASDRHRRSSIDKMDLPRVQQPILDDFDEGTYISDECYHELPSTSVLNRLTSPSLCTDVTQPLVRMVTGKHDWTHDDIGDDANASFGGGGMEGRERSMATMGTFREGDEETYYTLEAEETKAADTSWTGEISLNDLAKHMRTFMGKNAGAKGHLAASDVVVDYNQSNEESKQDQFHRDPVYSQRIPCTRPDSFQSIIVPTSNDRSKSPFAMRIVSTALSADETVDAQEDDPRVKETIVPQPPTSDIVQRVETSSQPRHPLPERKASTNGHHAATPSRKSSTNTAHSQSAKSPVVGMPPQRTHIEPLTARSFGSTNNNQSASLSNGTGRTRLLSKKKRFSFRRVPWSSPSLLSSKKKAATRGASEWTKSDDRKRDSPSRLNEEGILEVEGTTGGFEVQQASASWIEI